MSTVEPTPPTAPPEPEPVRRIQRSRKNRWILGVSGGLAEYFGLHPAIYRALFVALAFAGGTGIFLYLALALVMPDENAEDSVLAETLRRHRNRPWLVIGLALLALLLLSTLGDGPGDQVGALLLVLVVGGGIFLWSRALRRDRRRAAARGRRSVAWRLGAVAAVAAIIAVVAGGAIAAVDAKGGIGDRMERPRTAADLEDEYHLGAGELELDLSELELPAGETRVEASVGFGELDIILPAGVPVDVSGEVKWGEAEVLGRAEEGRDSRERIVDPGFERADRRLVVDAHVRGGELRVRR
jgi:phage shock protein PspC (stress-responsive transcriptional regulator)